MAVSLLPVIANGILSPNRVCDEFLHLCSSPHINELNADDYASKKISEKPDLIKNNDSIDNLYKKIKADLNHRPIRRSIQFSDLHLDLEYKEGTPAVCD